MGKGGFYLCFVSSVCGQGKADIVFLVDESSSIGPNNFVKIKDFIFRVATYFPAIGPEATQVGQMCPASSVGRGGLMVRGFGVWD